MRNLTLVKNKNGGYGILDLDTGRIVIPAMYERKQLEHITDIVPLSNFFCGFSKDIYVLMGYDLDNNRVYGLYNPFTNDFIEVIYDELESVLDENNKSKENMIMFIKGHDKLICDLNGGSQDNKPIDQKVKMFSNDNVTYGLIASNGEVIIPPKNTRCEMFNIGDIVEVFEGVYLLKDKYDSEKIVGFYDSTRGILKNGPFTSYEMVSNILVLKNKIKNNERRAKKNSGLLLSKTYISLYDPRNGKYIQGDYCETEMSEYESDGYNYEGYSTKTYGALSEINGIILLGTKAFYDTVNQHWQDDVSCYEINGKIKTFSNKSFIGYYDIEQRLFKRFTLIPCEGLEEYSQFNLYLSEDKKSIYFNDREYWVEEYSDFIKISDEDFTILFDKNYNFLGYENNMPKIIEIKPETVEQLGIPVNFGRPVYLIDGGLYIFRKIGSLAVKGGIYPNFIKVSSKVVGAVEYEYGVCSVEADSAVELDYKMDEIAKREEELSSYLENLFYQDETLMKDYPNLVRKD